jgi:hypothetical protein
MAANNLNDSSRQQENPCNRHFILRPDALRQTGWERHEEAETAAGASSADPTLCPLCKAPLKTSLENHLTLGCNALS